jgi:hypothetical protein
MVTAYGPARTTLGLASFGEILSLKLGQGCELDRLTTERDLPLRCWKGQAGTG